GYGLPVGSFPFFRIPRHEIIAIIYLDTRLVERLTTFSGNDLCQIFLVRADEFKQAVDNSSTLTYCLLFPCEPSILCALNRLFDILNIQIRQFTEDRPI